MSTRKAIRHAVRDLLHAQPLLAGRVHASRTWPVGSRALPVVLVYTERDAGEQVSDVIERRVIDIVIKVIVHGPVEEPESVVFGEGSDDELDDLCELVERVIQAAMSNWFVPAPALADLCDDVSYDATSLEYRGEDGRQDFISADMVYKATYTTSANGEFDDLTLVSVDIDMASPRNDPPTPARPDGQIDARADIVLPI